MATLVKDTHKVISFLQTKGYSAEQAEGIISAINENSNTDDFATKLDIKTTGNNLIKWFLGVHVATIALLVAIVALAL